MVLTPTQIWRGNPVSDSHQPVPTEIVDWADDKDTRLAAVEASSGGTVITASTSISVPGDFSTIQAALDSLAGSMIGSGVAVTIQLASQEYDITSSGPIECNHPQGEQIRIVGTAFTRDVAMTDFSTSAATTAATLAGICPTRIKNTSQAAFLVKTAIRLENLLLIGGTTGSPGDAIDMSNLATPSNPSVGCEDVGCVGFYHFADLKNGASFKCNFGQCFATHTVDSGISVIASSFRVLGSWLAWRTGDNGVVANRNAFIELQSAKFEDCCTNGTGADIRAFKNSTVECVLGTSTDSNNYALYAEDSAVIYAPGFAISGCANYAIFANDGATINCLKTGSTGMSVAMGSTGTFAVKLERVSQLYANDCTISGTGATLLSIDTGSFADINGGTINGTSTFAVIADMCSRVDANGCTVSGTGKWQSSRGAAINLENAVINANMILAASSASTNFGAGISGSGTVTYSPATNTESSNGSWNLA